MIDMAFMCEAPLLLAGALPAREVGALRGVNVGGQRICLSLNRQTGVRNSLSWFTCRAIGFDVHRSGTYGVEKRGSGDALMRRGLNHVVSSFGGDGCRAEELFEAKDDNAEKYPNDLSWDSYLGEVTTSEKVEEPPQYVPPPPISAEDICIRDKVESLLYILERVLPGRLDGDKAKALCSMLCSTVEGQNLAICFRGSDKCSAWLRALMQVQASINLHELYYENDMEDSDKRRVYTVWTVSFLEHVRGSVSDPIQILSESEPNQMSGETMFEMEKSGLVSHISSTWYVLQEDDGASFTKAKDSLYHLLQRTF
ncbi:hypothetical protein M758_7G123000 [Ceratodon purpureus]|nr:hypothetical protein M758_7G123000 [Ceratodon purpureus]